MRSMALLTTLTLLLTGCATRFASPTSDLVDQARVLHDSCKQSGYGEGLCQAEVFEAHIANLECLHRARFWRECKDMPRDEDSQAKEAATGQGEAQGPPRGTAAPEGVRSDGEHPREAPGVSGED